MSVNGVMLISLNSLSDDLDIPIDSYPISNVIIRANYHFNIGALVLNIVDLVPYDEWFLLFLLALHHLQK